MDVWPRDVQNIHELYQRELTRGDRIATAAAKVVGSWQFVVWQTVFMGAWIVLNVVGWARSWDPYPFILMNLLLSVEAAFTGLLVTMAQNRDAQRDRLMMLERG